MEKIKIVLTNYESARINEDEEFMLVLDQELTNLGVDWFMYNDDYSQVEVMLLDGSGFIFELPKNLKKELYVELLNSETCFDSLHFQNYYDAIYWAAGRGTYYDYFSGSQKKYRVNIYDNESMELLKEYYTD